MRLLAWLVLPFVLAYRAYRRWTTPPLPPEIVVLRDDGFHLHFICDGREYYAYPNFWDGMIVYTGDERVFGDLPRRLIEWRVAQRLRADMERGMQLRRDMSDGCP